MGHIVGDRYYVGNNRIVYLTMANLNCAKIHAVTRFELKLLYFQVFFV